MQKRHLWQNNPVVEWLSWRICLIVSTTSQVQYSQIAANGFFALFPHRFDYIWADYATSNETVSWKTETRHPLSDRLIQQGAYLYGVRFGAETRYCMLDIDSGSLYHPKRDPLAISRIAAALEPLGLVSYVACTSSYSGGLHLYFPFQRSQSSWKLAIAVATLLERAGFKVAPGHLEIFPDPKPYNVTGKPSLFNAHRLPLQVGSYLLNEEFQPIWSNQDSFVQQWQFAQARNDVESITIRQVLKQLKRHRYTVSTKAEKFINDLNAEIELGWTDFGQTNYLLGRIAMREYIFHHVLAGGQPLSGDNLVQAIVAVAQTLPGYEEYCRHCHEIEHRALEWARCIENSRYFHYGDAAGKFKAKLDPSQLDNSQLNNSQLDNLQIEATTPCGYLEEYAQAPTWNQQQKEGARGRIRWAIAHLLEQESLPANSTARFHALVDYGIGGGTLYKHRDLWHPNYLTSSYAESNSCLDGNAVVEVVDFGVRSSAEVHSNESPPSPPPSCMDTVWDCCEAAPHTVIHTSLFPDAGSNPNPDGTPSDFENLLEESGRNSDLLQGTCQAAVQLAYQQQQQHLKQQASEARQVALMQRYLESNDPILMAEAIAWAQINPGRLDRRNFSGEISRISS
ncbi:MAG: hypothetical protein NW224_17620 [Leptolyngbyaceae cyanobacterium bins.302]|nr:hypothetical protein [Leptolyngbyaceae cyanobacterium bins.302]